MPGPDARPHQAQGRQAHGRRHAPDLAVATLVDAELEVLKGLDFARHAPRYLLIETGQVDAVISLLGSRYRFVESLSHHDYLFARV